MVVEPYSVTWALLLGLGGVVGSGAAATAIGWLAQAAMTWFTG